MKTFKIAALAGALALAGAGHALAGNYTATYTGTVAGYSNAEGTSLDTLFGYGATDITGFAFSAVINYTTDVANSAFTDTASGGSGVVSSYGGPSVISSVTLTVGSGASHVLTFTPDFYANIESAAGAGMNGPFHQTIANSFAYNFQAYINTLSATPGDVTTPFTATGIAPDANLDVYNYITDNDEIVAFNPTQISVGVTPTSAAPEPGTWALMMAGVGLAGFALRRRTQATLAAA